MQIEDVVILVGGKGSRLGNITKNTPKPLIKIKNKSFLDYLLAKLIKYNFKKIFLLCSYKKDFFYKKYNNKLLNNSRIICIDEGKPMGTGGALYGLKKIIKKNFLLLNGDTYFDVNLSYLIKKKLSNKTIFLSLCDKRKSVNNNIMDNLEIKKGLISIGKAKTNIMNGGLYVVNKKILKNIKNKFLSFENDILKKEIQNNNVIGKYFNDFFIDIGSIQQLKMIKKKYDFLQNKCFFFDRDGVINKEVGYIKDYKNFIFNSGVSAAIKYLNKKNYLVIIITNQAAIGKQIITEKKLNLIHHKMKKNLYRKNNSIIDDIYYSPYYKDSKITRYRKNKYDRKPYSGMIYKAADKWNINLTSSYFIGDKITDKIAARRCNLKFYFKKDVSLYKQIKSIIK